MKIRRAVLTSLLTGSALVLSTGCSSTSGFSLASVNPFSQTRSTSAKTGESGMQSFASKTKSALTKSRDAVAGAFTRDSQSAQDSIVNEVKSDVDPLRLDQKNDIGPEVFVANGRLWESTGNLPQAMESYSKALKVRPNDAAALASIARLHFRQGNHVKATEFFQQAIKQNPDDASLHNDLGLTLSKVGNVNAASQSLTRALELSPGTSRYANNLASVKFEGGDIEGAFKVLSSYNKPAVAHYNMAYLLQQGGKVTEARVHLQKVIEYKQLGTTDSTVAQAVSRSQDMLAQLGVPNSAIASDVKIASSKPTTGGVTAQTVGQKLAADKKISASVAVAKTPSADPPSATSTTVEAKTQTGIPTSFATARLGSKTVHTAESTPVETVKESSAPTESETSTESGKSSSGAQGPFALPPGFAMPTQ